MTLQTRSRYYRISSDPTIQARSLAFPSWTWHSPLVNVQLPKPKNLPNHSIAGNKTNVKNVTGCSMTFISIGQYGSTYKNSPPSAMDA